MTVATLASSPPRLPAVWGHRGASAEWPENSLISFKQAILDGAEGIESDVHVSSDDYVLCCHDPHLDRTTTGRGMICAQPYKGGIDQLVTLKGPRQPVPTFRQVIELLCQPGFDRAVFNIDVKVDNDPDKLFSLMHSIIAEQPNYKEKLAHRLVLGLWHPAFIKPAQRHLPYARLSHIGISTVLARRHFFPHCDSFSLRYQTLSSRDGQAFIAECKAAGKTVVCWTVNSRVDIIGATQLGADIIITDRTSDAISLRDEMRTDWLTVSKEAAPAPSWLDLQHYSFYNLVMAAWATFLLSRSPVGPYPILARA